MKTSLIIGGGACGTSAAIWLNKCQHTVLYFDDHKESTLSHCKRIHTIDQEIDQAILSPGVPLTHPIVKKCQTLGIPVISEIQLAAQYIDIPIIGVTGTNGKTTTVFSLAALFNERGVDAGCYGNSGIPLTEYLNRNVQHQILICEISSFALDSIHAPILSVGILLNITEDHLDRYASFHMYAASKKKIASIVKGPCYVHHSVTLPSPCIPFSSRKELYSLVGAYFNCDFPDPKDVQVTHRLEVVYEHPYPFTVINDSKSTNIACVIHACKTIHKDKILMLGGNHKGSLTNHSIKKIAVNSVKHIIVFGPLCHLWKDLSDYCDTITFVETLQLGIEKALKVINPTDALLFSPGGTSFDAFSSFEERGERFKQIITEGI